jgi:signal transduction histidine kinase
MRETQIMGGAAKVVHVWTASNMRALLDRLLTERGPWSEVSIQLINENGHWRVVASPKTGSVEALASKEVLRFAVLLGLVFLTVVVAMFFAARSASRELALSRLRADFVASVSHELKTPLSLIRMFAESLREGWVSEHKRSEYYEVITRESERLTGLINNVLDYSRIESGTRKYQRVRAELGGIVRGLLERYGYHLKAANIELLEDLPSEAIEAFVDAEAIEQVLLNLLSNAVKYMGDVEGRPRRVTVSLRGSATHAVIQIADTGVGISQQDRLHIFERFWRADNAHVRAVAGSGLGLTLVKHVVDAHNGLITVQSTPGNGSTFAVTLPLSAGGQR